MRRAFGLQSKDFWGRTMRFIFALLMIVSSVPAYAGGSINYFNCKADNEDALADPPGVSDALHSEKLMRLPHAAWCYRPPVDAPAVAPPPSSRGGPVVFGSFNNLAKHSAAWFDMAAKILSTVPNSKMLMKRNALAEPTTRQAFLQQFESRGIDPNRVLAAFAITACMLLSVSGLSLACSVGARSTRVAIWLTTARSCEMKT